jgi:hypothetical protein
VGVAVFEVTLLVDVEHDAPIEADGVALVQCHQPLPAGP